MLYQREGIAKLPDSMNAAIIKINIKKKNLENFCGWTGIDHS